MGQTRSSSGQPRISNPCSRHMRVHAACMALPRVVLCVFRDRDTQRAPLHHAHRRFALPIWGCGCTRRMSVPARCMSRLCRLATFVIRSKRPSKLPSLYPPYKHIDNDAEQAGSSSSEAAARQHVPARRPRRHGPAVARAPRRRRLGGNAGPAGPRPAAHRAPLRRDGAGDLRRLQPRAGVAARGAVPLRQGALLRPGAAAGARRRVPGHQVPVRHVVGGRAGRLHPQVRVQVAPVQGVQLDRLRRGGHRRREGRARPPRRRGRVARHHAGAGVGRRPRVPHGADGRPPRGRRRHGAPRLAVHVHLQRPGVQPQPGQRTASGAGRGAEAGGRVQGRGAEHHRDGPQPRRGARHAQRVRHRRQRLQRGGHGRGRLPGDLVRVRQPARRRRRLQEAVRRRPGAAAPPRPQRPRRGSQVPGRVLPRRRRGARDRHGGVAVPEKPRGRADLAQPRGVPARRGGHAGRARRVRARRGAGRGAGEQGVRRPAGPPRGAARVVGAAQQGNGGGRRRALELGGLRGGRG
uniref:Uncharacterized protein n=1 Tax=Zea mays TaxID=4577 RepID=A0A804Q5U8_MAIZE